MIILLIEIIIYDKFNGFQVLTKHTGRIEIAF